MEFKKTFLILLGFLFLINSGYGADIYLTSCGNSVWNSEDTYYINFTNPTITSGTSCFGGDLNEVTIIQLNEKIIVNVPNNYDFFLLSVGVNHMDFYNLNIEMSNDYVQNYFNGGNVFWYSNFYECSFNKGAYLFYSVGLYIQNNNFYDCEILNLDEAIMRETYSASVTHTIVNNKFYNTLISLETLTPFISACADSTIYGNTIYNSSTNINYSKLDYITSVVGTLTDMDTNDDNVGDTNINLLMSINAGLPEHDYTFLQDVNEGLPFASSTGVNILMNNDNLSGANLLVAENDETWDLSFIYLALPNNYYNIQLSGLNNNLVCDLLGDSNLNKNCQLYSYSPTTSTNKYRPYIAIGNNNIKINNIDFQKSGTGNGNIIANLLQEHTYNKLLVNDSDFTQTTGLKETTSDLANNMIKLQITDLTITNNNFNVWGTSNSDVFEILYIDSTNPSSNTIQLNNFSNSGTAPTNPSEIFTFECDTLFYNNFIGNDIIVSNGCTPVINPLIGFTHTDGKVYYYEIGNYYEENTGCVDSDSDGFCDSPYTSGGVIDNKPLSSYPFDYTSHLFTADSVVTPNIYNITLHDIIDNETINLNSEGDGIILKFSQNSLYPDLTCNYVLDGGVINTISSPAQNIIYNYTKINWIEKEYSYRIECNNIVQGYVFSDEINFHITIGGGTIPPENNGTENNETTGNYFGSVGDLITGDVTETSDNAVGFFSALSNSAINIILPVGLFFFVILMIGGTLALIS